jgi:1-acyl-sn-glycerol-3-phosphate acyltransferase
VIARGFLRLAGMSITVQGSEHLPDSQCVVVANHASYLDGLVMTAVLPPNFAYVVKREMDRVPLAGLLLRRLGTEFVERFNRHKGATDARRVLRTATGGQSMVFFPEGTFVPEPGVLKFHNGAFATAARAGCPVVPIAVRGTRALMPCSSMLPRPGRIEVIVLPPLANPVSDGAHAEHAASVLRDHARALIVAASGEPDAA